MIIKPLDQNNGKKTLVLKILFILIIVLSGFLAKKYLFENKHNNNKNRPQVFGEKVKASKVKSDLNSDFLAEKINDTEKILNNVQNNTIKQVNSFIEIAQEKIASSVSEIIYHTSIEPIVSQIKKLPMDQQEKIKQDICRQ